MSDLGTQLRDYFDANVERVMPEDVLAGRRVGVLAPEPRLGWRASPRLAVGVGFALSVFIVGGSLGLGLALRGPGSTSDSASGFIGLGAGAPKATGWGLVGVAAILAAVATGFILLAARSAGRRARRKREEKPMTTTIDTSQADREIDAAHRTSRWLVAAVVVLAVAVVSLGAWVINDLVSTGELDPPADVQTIVDDFTSAWNTYDGDAMAGLVDESVFLHVYGADQYDLRALVALVEDGEPYGTQVSVTGEYVFIESAFSSYMVVPASITTDAATEGGSGVVIITLRNRDGEWKIIHHECKGNAPSF